ncbi:glycosyltransferase [Streptomyces sp. SPB074]|uniref:glycosyltransferase n=1 Tax=Streptomyces sp. (strain SPB074) TaxID=465543 RepID=UPI00017F23BC|nr:glycosyltransferase [Streptomyces sp. SPB074]EDY42411.1 UDP-glucose:polyglycerol phosphate glucosyltransferase [Streptomyces sp. SPB074]
MKIAFLVRDLCHMGGVVSATQNLAGALAQRHEVEIVALRKVRDQSYFPLDPRVRVRVLTDMRPHAPESDLDDPLAHEFPKVYPVAPTEKKPSVGRLGEKRLLHYLATTDADVVVSSSPRNTIMLSYAEGDYLRVTQEHSMPSIYADYYRNRLFEAYQALDVLTAVTPEEVQSIGRLVPAVRNRLAPMPNCVPASPTQATGRNKLIVTAGVLTGNKNHLALIEAFRVVVDKHPDWRLRIYGGGAEQANLRARIEQLGLSNSTLLMGPTAPVSPEFAKASVFVLPSKREAFGNVIVEAMAAGLPVVSFDADHGPRNIITHGEDGLIVPKNDNDGLAAALLELVEDEDRRRRMGRAAVLKAVAFQETASRERFEAILADGFARRALPRQVGVRTTDNGSLVVSTREPLPAGAEDGAVLVARPAGKAPGGEYTFPFAAEGTAFIPWRAGLPEGRWEFSLRVAAGHEVPLVTDGFGIDTREILGVPLPRPADGPAMELLLPYLGPHERLCVRSTVRPAHAEGGAMKVGDTAADAEIALWGAETGPGCELELVLRADANRVLSFPATAEPDGETRRVRARIDFSLLAAQHTGEERIWDVFLRPGKDAPRVRVSKLATDVLEPIGVYTYQRPVVSRPAQPHTGAEAEAPSRAAARGGLFRARPLAQPGAAKERVEIRPYYTAAAQLAFKTVTATG